MISVLHRHFLPAKMTWWAFWIFHVRGGVRWAIGSCRCKQVHESSVRITDLFVPGQHWQPLAISAGIDLPFAHAATDGSPQLATTGISYSGASFRDFKSEKESISLRGVRSVRLTDHAKYRGFLPVAVIAFETFRHDLDPDRYGVCRWSDPRAIHRSLVRRSFANFTGNDSSPTRGRKDPGWRSERSEYTDLPRLMFLDFQPRMTLGLMYLTATRL